MDNNTFFNSKNKDLLYNICRDELVKNTNYNIDDNKKYFRTFGEIMKIVFKHAQNKNDLTELNKAVLGKTIPYLQNEIEKKNLSNGPLLPPNTIKTQKVEKEKVRQSKNVSDSYESLMAERNNFYNKQNNDNNSNRLTENIPVSNQPVSNQPVSNQMVNNLNQPVSNQPVNNLNQPVNNLNQPVNNLNQPVNNQMVSNLNQMVNNQMVNNQMVSNLNQPVNNLSNVEERNDDFKIAPMSLGNIDNSGINVDNLNTYDSNNDEVDPMTLYEKYNNERQIQDSAYNKTQSDMNNFEDMSNENNNFIDNMLEQNNVKNQQDENKFQENLTMNINDQMSRANLGELKGQLDEKIDFYNQNKEAINIPTANDLTGVQTNNIYENNSLFEEFKKSLFEKRKYINRENLITISSGDRDWFNSSETRFNFQVKFNPSVDGRTLVPKVDNFGKTVRVRQSPPGTVTANTTYSGDVVYEYKDFVGSTNAALPREFRNVTSFEMVRVLVPIENIIIPFDNRVFIDFKSLPYLVLKIEEIEGLYSGTNSKLDKAFAQLVWDKDNLNEVLVNVKDNTGAAFSNKVSRQLKRGVCLMAAIGLEKKTFYPTPLSSLNKLTLNLMTPRGIDINNHPDVLKIEKINLVENIGVAKDAAAASIVASINVGAATDFTVTNGGKNGTFTNLGQSQKISVTSGGGNEAGIEFTITGTDVSGTSITETITGPGANATVSTSKFFSTVTAASSNGATAGNISVGNTNDININIEFQESTGFPFKTSKLCIQVIVFSYFSNRVFKIGDNIKIKGFVDESSDTFDINSFINRDEGHYIINLEKEDDTNEGFINTLYISAPGNLDLTKETESGIVVNNTSHTSEKVLFNDTDSSENTKNCKLINESLQSNYVFKVITREDDITNVMSSANI